MQRALCVSDAVAQQCQRRLYGCQVLFESEQPRPVPGRAQLPLLLLPAAPAGAACCAPLHLAFVCLWRNGGTRPTGVQHTMSGNCVAACLGGARHPPSQPNLLDTCSRHEQCKVGRHNGPACHGCLNAGWLGVASHCQRLLQTPKARPFTRNASEQSNRAASKVPAQLPPQRARRAGQLRCRNTPAFSCPLLAAAQHSALAHLF